MKVTESRIKTETITYETLALDGVRVMRPQGMSEVELACALHAMAQELLLGASAISSGPAPVNGNGHNRVAAVVAEDPQPLTKPDRRGMPRKKVVRRTKIKGGSREKLECGHTVDLSSNQKRHKTRSCEACWEAAAG
jgi:hypothetical protein